MFTKHTERVGRHVVTKYKFLGILIYKITDGGGW
jgi:hypothetical protein